MVKNGEKNGEMVIFCSTEKNKTVLKNYLNVFDEIGKQIEIMTDNMQYYHETSK